MSDSQGSTAPSVVEKRHFEEPNRRVTLSWGSYLSRLVFGMGLFVAGFVLAAVIIFPLPYTGNTGDLWGRWVAVAMPFVGVIAAAIVLPGTGPRRIGFALFSFLGCIFISLTPMGSNLNVGWSVLFYGLASTSLAAAWVVLRSRPTWMLWFTPLTTVAVYIGWMISLSFLPRGAQYGSIYVGWPELFDGSGLRPDETSLPAWLTLQALSTAALVVLLFAFRGLAGLTLSPEEAVIAKRQRQEYERDRAQEALSQQEAADARARVLQIQEWEKAYSDAHDGAPPPQGFAPPMIIQSAPATAPGTNGFAIVALILGLLGGPLGVVFGAIALGQIRRTGQDGRGMAIAGIVLGSLSLLVTLVLVIVALAL